MPAVPDQLHAALAPVCGRIKRQAALNLAVRGLATGAAVAFVLALCRVSVSGWWPTIAALAALVLFPVAGLVLGLLAPRDWTAAARAIDERYHFDDRTTTAVAATRRKATTPMTELLLRDALARLETVRASAVVPLRVPRGSGPAIALAALAAVLALVPLNLADYLPGAADSAGAASAGNSGGAALLKPADVAPAGVIDARRHITRHELAGGEVHGEQPPQALLRQTIVERYFAP
jgi:hypothetical protein